MRRDRVIKKMVAALPYMEGEYVAPHDEAARKKYGDIVLIRKICDSYTKMGRAERWPDNDTPMIIHAYSKEKDMEFYCTPTFLMPLVKGGTYE